MTLKSSDRYQYIFPNLDLIKQFQSENGLNGIFTFESNNYIHNYQTNILEKVNINNLYFDSNQKVSKVGFNTNYQFLIKNSNQILKIQIILKKMKIITYLVYFNSILSSMIKNQKIIKKF